jgi:hypothetical protein
VREVAGEELVVIFHLLGEGRKRKWGRFGGKL